MEKFKFEIPSIKRKQEAIEYINEFLKYNSEINGVGSLDKYIDNYEGWLVKLEESYNIIPNEKLVPSRTYFLIRVNDNKIIGMINIRLMLNENLKKLGGHIGYSVRPTERQKGYNKVNLYLGLGVCQKYGIKDAMLTCYKDNIASSKTMKALGGTLIDEWNEETRNNKTMQKYIINVDKSLEVYKPIYENLIERKTKIRR